MLSLTEWADQHFPSFPQFSELNSPGSSNGSTTQSQSSSSILQLFPLENPLFADEFIDNGGSNGGLGVWFGDGASFDHTMSDPPLPAMPLNSGLHYQAGLGDVNPIPVFQGGGPMIQSGSSSPTAGDPDEQNSEPVCSSLDYILTSFFNFIEEQPILDVLTEQFKVSTQKVRWASYLRRKHAAKYKCPREGCGRDFTRKWNLDSEFTASCVH